VARRDAEAPATEQRSSLERVPAASILQSRRSVTAPRRSRAAASRQLWLLLLRQQYTAGGFGRVDATMEAPSTKDNVNMTKRGEIPDPPRAALLWRPLSSLLPRPESYRLELELHMYL